MYHQRKDREYVHQRYSGIRGKIFHPGVVEEMSHEGGQGWDLKVPDHRLRSLKQSISSHELTITE